MSGRRRAGGGVLASTLGPDADLTPTPSNRRCAEILEFTSAEECSVCTLASLCLPQFVVDGAFDFEGFIHATKTLARNLDRVIDLTFYPVEEARRSNVRHRPVGIGVQGLHVSELFWDARAAARVPG